MQPTVNSFQGKLRIPEDVSIQLRMASTMRWTCDISARDIGKNMTHTESKKALHLHHRIAIITEVQILPISLNFRCLTK